MMKKIIGVFFLVFSSCFLLSGCGPMYNTTYSYVPAKSNSGKMCTMQCNQMKMMCQQSCNMQNNIQNNDCQQQAQQNAKFAYKAYKDQRRAEGKPIKKTLYDFLDTSSCGSFGNSSSCGCDENYRECFVSCGGQVIPHQQCVAFCNKAQPQSNQLLPQQR